MRESVLRPRTRAHRRHGALPARRPRRTAQGVRPRQRQPGRHRRRRRGPPAGGRARAFGRALSASGVTTTMTESLSLARSVGGVRHKPWLVPRPVASAGAVIVEGAFRIARRRPPICREMVRTLLHGHRYDGSRAERGSGRLYRAAGHAEADDRVGPRRRADTRGGATASMAKGRSSEFVAESDECWAASRAPSEPSGAPTGVPSIVLPCRRSGPAGPSPERGPRRRHLGPPDPRRRCAATTAGGTVRGPTRRGAGHRATPGSVARADDRRQRRARARPLGGRRPSSARRSRDPRGGPSRSSARASPPAPSATMTSTHSRSPIRTASNSRPSPAPSSASTAPAGAPSAVATASSRPRSAKLL